MTDIDLHHDDLQRENVKLHRQIVALTERAVDAHAAHGRDLVQLGLATLGTGVCVGASIGDAWLYVLYALAAAQVGTMLWWRNKP